MDLKTFVLMILASVFGITLVIVIIFIIINVCIKRKVANYKTPVSDAKPFYETNKSFNHDGQSERPPLPPRDIPDAQSLTNSYEEVPENPMVEHETSFIQNHAVSYPPETHKYIQDNISPSESYDDVDKIANGSYEEVPENPMVEHETCLLQNHAVSYPPETHKYIQDNVSPSESYDDVDKIGQNSYEDVTSLPDYLDVEPPPFLNESEDESENYDDVEQLHSGSEDYDDVV